MRLNDTAPLPDAKTCTKCGETKSIDQFSPSFRLRPTAQCRQCCTIVAQEWRGKNPGRAAAATQRWRDSHPEKVIEVARATYALHRDKRIEGCRRYHAANRDRMAEYDLRYYANHKEQALAKAKRWSARNPERAKISKQATDKVLKAIKKGILTRPSTCEACGITGVRIEAAHSDYSRPLDVRWLCRPCHVRWDQHDPKTLH